MGCVPGKLHIVVMCGSLRGASTNMALVRYIVSLPQTSCHIEVQDIGFLPLFNEDYEIEDRIPTSVIDLREKVKYADGVIFSTPEYNGSVSGVLKNAFDWLSRDYSKNNKRSSDNSPAPLLNKKCGYISVDSAIMSASYGSQRPIADIRRMGEYNKLQYAPNDYYLSLSQKGLFENYELKSQAQKQKLQKWLNEFIIFLLSQAPLKK